MLCQHCAAHKQPGQRLVTCTSDCGEEVHESCPATDRGCGLPNTVLKCLKCARYVRLKRTKVPVLITVTVQAQRLQWLAHWRTADNHGCGVDGPVPKNSLAVFVNDGENFLIIQE